MKKSDAQFLFQLAESLEKAEAKLEEYYGRKDYDNFEKTKKYLLDVQKKIAEVAG